MGKYESNVAPCLTEIRMWARGGVTEKDIAKRLRVAYSTLRKYAQEREELRGALSESKEGADAEVESSLFERATGFYKTVKKAFKLRDVKYSADGKRVSEKERIEYAEEEIYYPPEVNAVIFWLTNRRPEEWRRKTDVDISGKDGKIKLVFEQKGKEGVEA